MLMLDNQLITLQMSRYDGQVVNASDYGIGGARFESPWSPISVLSQYFVGLFFFLICSSETAKDKKLMIDPQLLYVF